jgi:CheY-like chemotaxis protein
MPGKTILLCEDDPDIRDSVTEILEEAGYTVLGATSGDEALRLLSRHERPALLLLDLMMPGMNGWELYKELRQDPLWSSIPIVVFSAMPRVEGYADAIGAVEYLRKPLAMDELLGAVARHTAPQGAA